MENGLFEKIENYVEDEAKLDVVSDFSFNLISPYSNYPVESFQSLIEDKLDVHVEYVDFGEFEDDLGYKKYYYRFDI